MELPSADVLWHCVNTLDASKQRISVTSIYLWSLSIATGEIYSLWKWNMWNETVKPWKETQVLLFCLTYWRNENDHLPQASTLTEGLLHEKLILVYVQQLLSADLCTTHWDFFQNICWRALNPHMVLLSSFLGPLLKVCENLSFPSFYWTEKWLTKEHSEWNPSEFIANFCLLWRLIILRRARRRGSLLQIES